MTKTSNYISVETGNKLIREEGQFFWRGKHFSGLVDEEDNALYDDPKDSFSEEIGIESSLEQALIKKV